MEDLSGKFQSLKYEKPFFNIQVVEGQKFMIGVKRIATRLARSYETNFAINWNGIVEFHLFVPLIYVK